MMRYPRGRRRRRFNSERLHSRITLGRVHLEFLFDPSCFDSMSRVRDVAKRVGSVISNQFSRQMTREGLLQEKSNLKKRFRAYDARLMKMNNIVASKVDKNTRGRCTRD